MPRWTLLAVLLLALPTLAVERPVAPLDLGAVPRDQLYPAVAPFGDGWLVAWEDAREGYDVPVYAARLSATGEVLDPLGIRLPSKHGGPAVACAADRCLVIDRGFYAGLVGRDGTVKDLGRLVEDYTLWPVGLFWNGSEFLLFWTPRILAANGAYMMILDADGNVKARPERVLPQEPPSNLSAAAFNGSRIALMYQVQGNLRLAMFSATGTPLARDITLDTSGAFGEATIAPAAGGFVAAWGSWALRDIVAVRVDDDGALHGPAAALQAGSAMSPRLVRAGDGFVLHHLVPDPLQPFLVSRPLSSDLVLGPAENVPIPEDSRLAGFAVAPGRAEPLVITALRFTHQGTDVEVFAVGDAIGDAPRPVTRSAPAQNGPAIAVGSGGTIVAWQQKRGVEYHPRRELHAAVLDRNGGAYREFTIAAGDIAGPEVAAAGDAFLVVWRESTTLRGRLIRHGELSETLTIAENVAPVGVAVSSIGDQAVVAWTHAKPNRIALARVFADGTIVWRPQAISLEKVSTDPHEPALACANGECLLVWRALLYLGNCPWPPCITESRVLASRLDASLTSRDAQPLELRGTGPIVDSISAAAGGDGSYAVGWSSGVFITVRVLDPAGALGPAIRQTGYRHALARQGRSWVLVRNAPDAEHPFARLAVFRFSSSGGIADSVLHRDGQWRAMVAAASDGDDVVIVYERTTRGEAAGGVPRIYLDVLEPLKRTRAVRH